MPSVEETVEQVAQAATWNHRVQTIRRIPELHGQQEQQTVYAVVARRLYRPHLSPQVAYVKWRPDYTLEAFSRTYRRAFELTSGFVEVEPKQLQATLLEASETLLVFRTMIGFTQKELAVAVSEVAQQLGLPRVSSSRIKSLENGGRADQKLASVCAQAIHELVTGALWREAPEGLQSKLEKIDTGRGWESVRELATSGVPYDAFLHQRHAGGAFRQLLDATSETRGELLEEPVELLLQEAGVAYLRTSAGNQQEIVTRFNLTVKPAPDFVVFEPPDVLKAMIECKQANDGGTARDKAARFRSLRQEAMRLGGVALFAVLDGLGWERTKDALGPVVRDCDGRVFTFETLQEMLTVQPFPGLIQPISPS